jgi:hypothetical protein
MFAGYIGFSVGNERSDNDDGDDSGGRFRPPRGPLSSPLSSTDFDGLSNKDDETRNLNSQTKDPSNHVSEYFDFFNPDPNLNRNPYRNPYRLGLGLGLRLR